MRRRAFTLIELLVVIAIMTLLIAILLPSLSKARKRSKATVCLNNMRGIGLAVHMYATANDGHLVKLGLGHGGSVIDPQGAWINTLRKNYGDELLARCPSDRSPHWTQPIDGSPKVPAPELLQPVDPIYSLLRHTSYAMNYYTQRQLHNRGPYNRLSLFKRPSTTIYIVELAETGDQSDNYATADHVHPDTWISNPRTLAAKQIELEHHLGLSNYGFIDAHAEPLTFEQTYAIDKENTQFPTNIAWKHNMYDPYVGR